MEESTGWESPREDYWLRPYSVENVARLAYLHSLCVQAEMNYTLNFNESGREWFVTIDDASNDPGFVSDNSSLLEYPLKEGIENMQKYLEKNNRNFPSKPAGYPAD